MKKKQPKYECHDCGKPIKIIEKKEIANGYLCKYKDGENEYLIFKCKDCHKDKKALTEFQECEVYSRVCGYLRPVQQWNTGKVQEHEDKKTFKI